MEWLALVSGYSRSSLKSEYVDRRYEMITSVDMLTWALIIWLIWSVVITAIALGLLVLLDGYEDSCMGMIAILFTLFLHSVLVYFPIGVIVGSALKHLF